MIDRASKVKSFSWVALLFFVATISYSCATMAQSSELPVWVDNPAEQFSSSRYLMAVGSSSSRQGAKDQAQANLAKIFVSQVNVDESHMQDFREATASDGEITVEENTQLITQSRVKSDQQLKNVQIKEMYESDNGIYYALAAMDRMETAQLYSKEIQDKREAIQSLREKSNETANKLERLIYLKRALAYARINEMLVNQRAILRGFATQELETVREDVLQEYHRAKKECTVKVRTEDVPRQIISAINRQLQNEGFTVLKNSDRPTVIMDISFSVEPVDLDRPNTKFAQWHLQVEAQDNEKGNWFSTYQHEGREGSLNESYARKRAIQAGRKKINNNFASYIKNELLSIQ